MAPNPRSPRLAADRVVRRRPANAARAATPLEAPAPRSFRLIAIACGMVAFAVYAVTASRTVPGGDSGELIAAAYTLGVPHPPGFPLYVLLAKLFTLLPLGSVAWEVNLFSAVCDALAAAVLCEAVMRWTGSLWAGVLAALAFALSPFVWPGAVTAEVFALNNLFVAGLIAIAAHAALEPSHRRWLVPFGMLWLGLGLSNHHTLVFAGIPFALYLLSLEPQRLRDPRHLLRLAGAFVLGLVPYLYLPVASASHSPVVWGDQTTWSGFLSHVLRREYGTFRLAAGHAGAVANPFSMQFQSFWARFGAGTLWLGPPLLIAALVALSRRSMTRGLVAVTAAAFLLYVVVFSALSNLDLAVPLYVRIQDRFWQQAMVLAAALMGVGFAELLRRLRGNRLRAAAPVLAIGLPAALAITQAPGMNHRGDHLVQDYGRAVLESLPPGAIALISGDTNVGSARYMEYVVGMRRDVRLMPAGLLQYPWYRKFAARILPGVVLPRQATFTCRQFLDANHDRVPVYLVGREPWMESLEQAYAPWSMGLVEIVLPKGQAPDPASWIHGAEAGFARFDGAAASRFPAGSDENELAIEYWKQYQRFGFALARAGLEHRDDPAATRMIVAALERVAARHPAPSPMLYKNLGVGYQLLSSTDPEAKKAMVRVWKKYLATAVAADPDMANIRILIDRAESTP